MKIGALEFKEYAARKPITTSPTGQFVTASEVLANRSLSLGSLFTLDTETQVRLAVERYALEPDFRLGVMGMGVYTKAEIMEHLRMQSAFGQLVLRAEMGYCSELMAALTAPSFPAWPAIPDDAVPTAPDWRGLNRCFWIKVPTRALFCENTTDNVTTPIANYRIANVHPAFQKRGFTVTALTGKDDVRANFVTPAKNTLTVYLGGVGHGAYPLYTGHWHDRILEVGKYEPAEVRGKAIHFLSCQTATKLGPDTVSNGARAYAGYTENFIFVWDDSSTPVDEFLLFVKGDSVYDLMMANGATAQQAYDTTVNAFNAAIGLVPGTAAATWLTWDRDHLKLHGDPATVIAPYRYVRICFPFPATEQLEALVLAGELTD